MISMESMDFGLISLIFTDDFPSRPHFCVTPR